MSDGRYREVAELLRALGHPARLRILDETRREPSCVCHLQAVLKRPQAYVSQQLRLLREGGLVVDEKEGLNVYYRLGDGRAAQVLEAMLGAAGAPSRPVCCPCPHCARYANRGAG